MWTVEGHETDWPKLSSLQPEHILDSYDGPRLFTVRTADGLKLLAYQCGANADVDRFLLVPTSEELLAEIEDNLTPLRDALLSQPWAWLIDRTRGGTLSRPLAVDPRTLPLNALPKEGVRLFADTNVLLRLRMLGGRDRAGTHSSERRKACGGRRDGCDQNASAPCIRGVGSGRTPF
jgi:Family of unknown function (DUF6575)